MEGVINVHLHPEALGNVVKECKRNPDLPFVDTGEAIEQILAAGVSKRDPSPTTWRLSTSCFSVLSAPRL